MPELNQDLIGRIVDIYAKASIPAPRMAMSPTGGAMNRVTRDATAFWHRSAAYGVIMQTSGDHPSEDAGNIGWVRSNWPTIEPLTTGFYANITQSDTEINPARSAYGDNYERLAEIKGKYDPANLFRLNANIKPRV